MKYLIRLIFCYLMLCSITSTAQLLSVENCFSGTKDDNYYFGYKFSETDSIRYIAVQSYSENNFFDTINRNIYRPGFSNNNIYLIRLNENSNTTKVIYANNIFPKNFLDNEINLEYVLNNTQIDSFVTLNIFKFDRNLDSITPFLQLEKYNVAQTGNPDIGIGFYVNSDSFHYAYGYSSRYSKIIRYKYDQTHLIQSDEIHTLRNTNNIFGTSDPDVTVFNHKIYEYINGVLKIYDAEANELASYRLLTRESSKYIDLGNGDLLLINQFRDSINFVKIKNDNSIEYNTIGISYVNNTVRINTQEYFSLIDSNLLIPFFDSDSAYFIRYNKNGNILNHYAEKYPINGSGGLYYGSDNLAQLNDSIKIILKKINNTENTIYIQKINKNGVPIQSTQLNPTIFYQNRLLVLKGYNKLIKTRKGRYFIIAFYNGYLLNSVLYEYNPNNGSLTLLTISDEYNSYKDVYNNDKNETFIIADINNGCIRNTDVVLYKLANGINTVKGKVFVDYNNNNTQDTDEPIYENAKLSYTKNNITYSSFLIDTGVYSFVIDTGKYIINCGVHDSLFTVLPTNRTITHATYNNTDFINFILKPIGTVYDAEVTMNNTFVTRPGFDGTYAVTYSNNGNYPLTNFTVKSLIDNRLIVNSASKNYTINGDTLIWNNLATLQPAEAQTIFINFTASTPSILNNGDLLQSTAFIDIPQRDTNISNNQFLFSETALGSYDPNDKTVNETVLNQTQILQNKELVYTIRFENNGTDTAFNITIRDTLPDNVNINSLQPVTSSHPYTLKIEKNKILIFYFKGIKLPAKSVNSNQAHGFVSYKIKTLKNFNSQNLEIKNTAHIIFDYNLPISTNTATTRIQVITDVISKPNFQKNILIYPNPASEEIRVIFKDVKAENISMQIIDVTGNIIMTQKISENDFLININSIPSGIYLLTFDNSKEKFVSKIIISR